MELNHAAPGRGGRSGSSGSGELRNAATEVALGRFFRAFQVLLKSVRLYAAHHPQAQENLAAAERELRAAQAMAGNRALGLRVQAGQLLFAQTGRGIADPRGELKPLADELVRRGISHLVLEPQANLGDLANLALLLSGKPPMGAKRTASRGPATSPAPEPESRLPAEGPYLGDWPALLFGYRITGVRVNAPIEHLKADPATTGLLALVLHDVAGERESGGGTPRSEGELAATLDLLGQIGVILQQAARRGPQPTVTALRVVAGDAPRPSIAILAAALGDARLPAELSLEEYLERLTEAMVLAFVRAEFEQRRVAPREVAPLLERLARGVVAPAAGPGAATRLLDRSWSEERWAEHLLVRFWCELHDQAKFDVLHSHDAWCVPVAALRHALEPACGDHEASRREARAVLLDYARCLLAEEAPARRTTAIGLSEMQDVVERLWPEQLPDDLMGSVIWAMVDEHSPEVAGILSAVVARLAQVAFERRQYGELYRILEALGGGRGPQQAHMTLLAQRLLPDARWQVMVEAGLEHRALDGNLVRILARDPERLIDTLGVRLMPGDLRELPAMARLIRAVGEPAAGTLAARLFDPRHLRAAAAVKLLAATHPERLLAALPQALPSWEWNLQDMAISELVSAGGRGASEQRACAGIFLATVPQAHPLVVPMMLDQVGLAREAEAVPLLVEIAAGRQPRLKDVFVRIKAIEALGRIGPACGPAAADLLRALLRERRGLTHVEPAGLRAAAEEALGLIENWPSSARVRMVHQALEKASVPQAPPRRYLRIPLDSPLPARIEGSRGVAARVRTISLGGALLESAGRHGVGEALEVEIRAGLRRIHSKAVVRNVSAAGSGVEFVQMSPEDREKLRRLVTRLMRS